MAIRNLLMTLLGLLWAGIMLCWRAFLALLFDANRDSELVQRLFQYSDFWVKPFFGVLDLTNETVEGTGGVFEAASFIALVAYFILGVIVFALVNLPFTMGGTGRSHGHAHG